MDKYSNYSGGGGRCVRTENNDDDDYEDDKITNSNSKYSKYSNYSGGGGKCEKSSETVTKDSSICNSNKDNKDIISIVSNSTSTENKKVIVSNSTSTENKKVIVSTTIGTGSSSIVDFPNRSPLDDFKKEEDDKIDRITEYFEKLRMDEPQKFGEVLMANKNFIDIVTNYKDKKDLEELDAIINSINYNIDLLYWSFNKGLRVAILEKKSIELVHFFIVKHKQRLDTFYFRHIVSEYIESFKDLNFIEIDDDKIELYTLVLEILITAGKANIEIPNEITRKTPFHLVVQYNQYQFILFLSRFGVNIDHFDKDLKTPLDVAIEKSLYGDLVAKEIVRLLYSMNARAFKHSDYYKLEVVKDVKDENEEIYEENKDYKDSKEDKEYKF